MPQSGSPPDAGQSHSVTTRPIFSITSNPETPECFKDEGGTQNGCKHAVERTERLEGSRFVAWQLYWLLAGGSRERLSAMFCRSRLFCYGDTTAHRTAARRDVPGSRLLGTFLGRDSHATN